MYYIKHRSFAALFAFCFFILLPGYANASSPGILVTIKPLHSLVSGLVHGIGQPVLLLDGMQSPHDYQLKPSERRLLESADIIFYASDTIESFIPPIRKSLGSKQIIALDTLPGLQRLPARGTHSHDADYDGHIWLSPANAVVIVKQLAEKLAQLDPLNRDQYFSNRDHLLLKLDKLKQQIDKILNPVHNLPFLQFHDALQYFERDFALTQSVAVTTGAEHSPGARHIRNLQQQIQEQNITCFFYEPPRPPKLLQTLDVNRNATMQALEIHGSQLPAGEELYFTLLQDIASQIHECLQSKKAH